MGKGGRQWMRHDNYCCYCGRQIIWPLYHTWEHIIPKSKGGSDHGKNKRTCCNQCNKYRGNRDLNEWKEELLGLIAKGWDYKTFKTSDMEIMVVNIENIQQAVATASPDMFQPHLRQKLFKNSD
jgi:hypothetical protein